MLPLVRNIRRRIKIKELVFVSLAILISVSAGIGVFYTMKKDVIIDEAGKQLHVKTMVSTVEEVLEQNGINVTKDDYISRPLDSKLQRFAENRIDIIRAVPVNILADGIEYRVMTYRDTVEEALEQSPVKLSGLDRLEDMELEDRITEDMTIKVVRVKEELLSEKTPIPFKVVSRENNHLNKGTERIVKEGVEGVQEKQFKVIFEDGKEIARQLIKDFVALEPINKIIEIGTVLNHKTARGEVVRYRKVMDMKATAYTASYKDTGKHPDHPQFGITYTGIRARKGVIAVDPKVIPLGTRVYVEIAGSTPDYGYAVAGDIGGAIKGNKIDLYYDDQSYVDKWGVKNVKVYILTDQ